MNPDFASEKLRKPCAGAILTSLLLVAAGTWGADRVTKNLFLDTGSGLRFESEGWSLASHGDRGWVSLKAGESEFLGVTPRRGAFAFLKKEQWFVRFPDRGLISHDEWVGRRGSVADGVNIVTLSPDWHSPSLELYLGANEKETQKAVMFLNEAVMFVRCGGNELNRAWMRQIVDCGSRTAVRARTAVAVHRDGCALVISCGKDSGDFEVAAIRDDSGAEQLAVLFPVKGFAPNIYRLELDAVARGENFALAPRFDVKSSDDPQPPFEGATLGVGNPVYSPDTKLDFGIVFGWLGPSPFSGAAELEIVHSLGEPRWSRATTDLVRTPDGLLRAEFKPRFGKPGIYEVWGRLLDAAGRVIWIGRYRAGWDIENFRPNLVAPADFSDFWAATLAELRAIPLEAETVRVAEFADHPVFEIYDVTFNGWERRRIHAMLFVPKEGARPMPAIVTAHPGITGFGINKKPDGTYGSDLKHDPRFVTIVPLIRGHAPDAPDIPFNHPWWGPLDGRDTYAARSWYCAMVRAVDYLATRPDIADLTRIVAKGGSQGGALALVSAALDRRIAVCLADCPACCQPHEIMTAYPSFGPSKGQIPADRTLEDTIKMLSYYNPVNFCPMIRCPTYVGSNIGDLTVHSMGPLAAYHNLTGLGPDRKAFYPGFTHAHGSGPGLGVKTKEVLDSLAGSAGKGE